MRVGERIFGTIKLLFRLLNSILFAGRAPNLHGEFLRDSAQECSTARQAETSAK
jgi:hypothetical protein